MGDGGKRKKSGGGREDRRGEECCSVLCSVFRGCEKKPGR